MFCVPDDILEELTCDICHKYLSAGPVNVDSGRRKKCGRCGVDNNFEEALSTYRHFGENALFKCINRFDGCDELLTYDEVIEHEKNCAGNKYKCPLCKELEEMQVFELLYHFKKTHHQNYLKEPTLTKKLSELQDDNIFLYLKDNYIFFIFLEFQKYMGRVLLNSFFIGGGTEIYNIKQKYCLYIEGLKICDTNKTDCSPLKNYNEEKLIVNCEKLGNLPEDCFVIINFEFYIPLKVNKIMKINESYLKRGSTFPSRVRRLHEVRKLKFTSYGISVSQCNTKFLAMDWNGNQMEINPACKYCSEISELNIYITKNTSESKHLICVWCSVMERNPSKWKDIMGSTIKDLKPFIKYSCIWNCGRLNKLDDIFLHELSCKRQPKLKCPFANCLFNGTFDFMTEHMREEHDQILRTMPICLTDKTNEFDEHYFSYDDSPKCFYVWIYPAVILKCIIRKESKSRLIIKTQCVDKSLNLEFKVILINCDFFMGKLMKFHKIVLSKGSGNIPLISPHCLVSIFINN